MAPQFNLLQDPSLEFNGAKNIVTRIFNKGFWFMTIKVRSTASESYYRIYRITKDSSLIDN